MKISVQVSGTGLRSASQRIIDQLAFVARRSHRHALVSRRQACRQPDDYFDFAIDGFPGGPSQNRGELLSFIEYASTRAPGTIVELGTEAGGTTFVLSQAIPSVHTVVAVDLWVQNGHRLRAFKRPGQDFHLINGPSNAPSTTDQLHALLGGAKIDLLLIDADHTFAGAWGDFLAYRPFLDRGSLVAFHDIVPDCRLREGGNSGSYVGEVPVVWQLMKGHFPHREFVDDWRQDGRGIGAIEFDPAVSPSRILFPMSADGTHPSRPRTGDSSQVATVCPHADTAARWASRYPRP